MLFTVTLRYTKNLDVWLATNTDNARRLLQALADFGFGSLDLTVNDFATPGYVIQLGQPPNRIDLLTSLTGVEFEQSNLKRSKTALGRYQDLADLEQLGQSEEE